MKLKKALDSAKSPRHPVLRMVRRIAVIVAGSVVLLAGLAMIVLPGPAIIMIPLGVSILATEIPIARKILIVAKRWIGKQRRRHRPAARRLWKRLKRLIVPHRRSRPRPS